MRSRSEIDAKLDELAAECEAAFEKGEPDWTFQYQAAIWGIRWAAGDIEDLRLYPHKFANGGPF